MDFTPSEITTRIAFGANLRQLIKARGLSQSDFAASMFGRDPITGGARKRDLISSYCKGQSFPTKPMIKAMAKALGIKTRALMPRTVGSWSKRSVVNGVVKITTTTIVEIPVGLTPKAKK